MGVLDFIFQGFRKKPKPAFSNDPVIEARRAIYKRKLSEDLTDYTICLTDYENQATLKMFKPDVTWSIDFYRSYIRAYAREVRKRGAAAKVYKVFMQDYLNWLRANKYKNCPENLEHFVEYLHNSKTRIR